MAPDIHPTEVLAETHFQAYDVWTHRIAPYRSPPELEAWIEARWQTLGSPRRPWMFPEPWAVQEDENRWLRLGVHGSAAAWLTDLFRIPRQRSIVFLSDDAKRLLALFTKGRLDHLLVADSDLEHLLAIRTEPERLAAYLTRVLAALAAITPTAG